MPLPSPIFVAIGEILASEGILMPLISLGLDLCLSPLLPDATYLKGVNLCDVVLLCVRGCRPATKSSRVNRTRVQILGQGSRLVLQLCYSLLMAV